MKQSILRLVLLFGVFLASVIGFVSLADEVFDQDTIAFDEMVLTYLNSHATPFWDSFFLIITDAGGVIGVLVVTVLALALLIRKKYYRKALILAAGVGGAALLNVILKLIFERPRPDLWEQLVVETSFSFPSGHAMASSALALSIIVVMWTSRYRVLAIIGGLSYIALIGLSRLYLGVHYPSDVAAGWLVSTAWVIAVVLVVTHWSNRYHRRREAKALASSNTIS